MNYIKVNDERFLMSVCKSAERDNRIDVESIFALLAYEMGNTWNEELELLPIKDAYEASLIKVKYEKTHDNN